MRTRDLMIVVTTLPDRAAAETVARGLIDAGLAVCAQVGGEMTSLYRWQGEVKADTEVRLTLKVLAVRYDLCAGELKLLHPYDVPQIIAWSASHVDEAYLNWAKGRTP